jgi:rare lipoprotein A
MILDNLYTILKRGIKKWGIITALLFVMTASLTIFLQANKSEETLLTSEQYNGIKSYDNYNSLDLSNEYLYQELGQSSWYGKKFHNRKTASGEKYNMYAFSAAHKSLPFGTILKVTNNENNQATFVRINDRGPFIKKRIIDLSMSAYNDIEPRSNPQVKIEALINKDYNLFDNSKIEYYFGYSLTRPLVCLPYSNFKVVLSLDDFDAAVEFYKNLSEKYLDKNFYLLIPANEKNPERFTIAMLDANTDENLNLEFAENY